ncbi:hypothetical protein LOTGIDRAFT_170518 [Lottia gigantea]|uniref:Fatty acyl-CoA reductase n=1 Tax=Lottia gigantea TaxID=225164 RepID=V4CQE1_LOTGI|nr:hypothetical protein LOTGIDRAFT_170518 [Lottia gigantea]ESP04680.1 hypothetical protein LOTGIDRAFT_170518 [Lottia gigantea]
MEENLYGARVDNNSDSPISEFYAGKNLFVTGGTGFLGKVLIEKILRSCPGLGTVYVLTRKKRCQDIHERIHDLLSSKLFDKLRKDQPNFEEKIQPIEGDIILPEFGLSNEDRQLLINDVHIVFHSAATIKFDEHLRTAVELNVLPVRKIIKLCQQFKSLLALVHVSTAYCNCDRPYIEETIYEPHIAPQKLIDALEWMTDDMVESVTPKLLGSHPNTYTFTKQLAEAIYKMEGAGLPVAIIRPSIVGAAWKEPIQGWIDNFNGASGLCIASGKGLLRSMKGDFKAVADLVPVDIPTNIMIVVGWYTAVYKPKESLVYNCTSGAVNPLTWGDFQVGIMDYFKKTPLEGSFRRPYTTFTSNEMLHDYWVFVSHMIPAYLADFGYRLMGKKPRMVRTYNKLHRSMEILSFFTTHSWEWTSGNHDLLRHVLSDADKKTFYFDPRQIHWPTYLEKFCFGAKHYVLNEDMNALPAARAHIKKLRNIRYMFNTCVIVVLWRVLIARSQIAQNVWNLILSLVFKFVRYFKITSTIQKH